MTLIVLQDGRILSGTTCHYTIASKGFKMKEQAKVLGGLLIPKPLWVSVPEEGQLPWRHLDMRKNVAEPKNE